MLRQVNWTNRCRLSDVSIDGKDDALTNSFRPDRTCWEDTSSLENLSSNSQTVLSPHYEPAAEARIRLVIRRPSKLGSCSARGTAMTVSG